MRNRASRLELKQVRPAGRSIGRDIDGGPTEIAGRRPSFPGSANRPVFAGNYWA